MVERTDDAGKPTGTPTCRVVSPARESTSKQGLPHAPAISAQSVSARGIHMQIVSIPPGGKAKAHKHEGHETALHVLSGQSGMWFGEKLEHHLVAKSKSLQNRARHETVARPGSDPRRKSRVRPAPETAN